MEILSEARTLGGGSGLVFPSPEGRASAHSRLSTLLRDLGIAAVPHGFRSSFRDWCGECSNAPREVAEAALAHAVRNKVEAAYARSDLFGAQACPDGRLGCVSRGRASGPGGPAGRLIRRARSAGGRVRQALKSGGAKAGSRPVSSHEPAYPFGATLRGSPAGAGEGGSAPFDPLDARASAGHGAHAAGRSRASAATSTTSGQFRAWSSADADLTGTTCRAT